MFPQDKDHDGCWLVVCDHGWDHRPHPPLQLWFLLGLNPAQTKHLGHPHQRDWTKPYVSVYGQRAKSVHDLPRFH